MSTALGHHIRLRLINNAVLTSTPRGFRTIAQVVLEKARNHDLLSFGLADNHLHIITGAGCEERAAHELGRRVALSLRRRLTIDARFEKAYVKPILDAAHLRNAFTYPFRQDVRHGLSMDPTREASNAPDLVGARILGAYTVPNVMRALPRTPMRQLYGYFGVEKLEPADGPLEAIVPAARAAAGLHSLAGSTSEVFDARRAVIAVVGDRLDLGCLARLLGVSRRTVSLLKHRPAPARLVQATRLQIAIRSRVPASALEPLVEERAKAAPRRQSAKPRANLEETNTGGEGEAAEVEVRVAAVPSSASGAEAPAQLSGPPAHREASNPDNSPCSPPAEAPR